MYRRERERSTTCLSLHYYSHSCFNLFNFVVIHYLILLDSEFNNVFHSLHNYLFVLTYLLWPVRHYYSHIFAHQILIKKTFPLIFFDYFAYIYFSFLSFYQTFPFPDGPPDTKNNNNSNNKFQTSSYVRVVKGVEWS